MELMPFQVDGVRRMRQFEGRALLGDEMGLGKTVQALVYLRGERRWKGATIVCPAYLKENWRREVKKWLPNIPVHIFSGKKAKAVYPAGIRIINYESLTPPVKGKTKPGTWTHALKAHGDTIIMDEGHYIKNRSAGRSRACQALCANKKHVLILTGTPIENRVAELWFPLSIIVPGLFPSWWKFANRYCGPKFNGFGMEFKGSSNVKELRKILMANVLIRRRKADVLKDLPAKRRATVPVTLPASAMKEYTMAETNFSGWMESNNVGKEVMERRLAGEALTKMNDLINIVGKGKVKIITDWVVDQVEQCDNLVLFTVRRNMARRISKHLKKAGVDNRVITGELAVEGRQKIVDDFQAGKLPVIIGTIKAMGTGFTLTKASNVAFAQLPWSPGMLDQAEDRLHRIGQLNPVNVWYLMAQDTIEEHLASMVNQKRKVVTSLIDGKGVKSSDMIGSMMRKMRKTK